MKRIKKGLITTLMLAVLLMLVIMVLINQTPIEVESTLIERHKFSIAVEAQGRTQAKDPYIVAAPISGRLLRSEFSAGDTITQGQIIARIALLPEDSRTEAVARANLIASEARYNAVVAVLMESESVFARAVREEERRSELFKENLISSEEKEQYRQLLDVAQARMLSNKASLAAAAAEIERARSLLLGTRSDDNANIHTVTAPVDGTIYRIYQESERVIQAGTSLFAISNDDALEIIVDLLTQDAVQIKTGNKIHVSGWGGNKVLEAIVKYVEPAAFTKISALGVEEQRVNVIGEFAATPDSLGAEYRIEAAIIVWEEDNIITIPTNAIFQRSNGWHTFVIKNGRASLRQLEIGRRSYDHAQVLQGIIENEAVIMFPSALIEDGIKVMDDNATIDRLP